VPIKLQNRTFAPRLFTTLLTIVIGGLDMVGRQIPALGATAAAERIAQAMLL